MSQLPDPHKPRFSQLASIATIVLTLVVVRVGLAYALRDSFFDRGNRSTLIDDIATTLLRENVFGREVGGITADQEPLYCWLIAAVYGLFGRDWMPVVFVHCMLGVVQALAVAGIARMLCGSVQAGIVAGLTCLAYPYGITQSISISDMNLFCPLLAVAVYVSYRAVEAETTSLNWIAGVVWGFVLLTRFSAIALFPCALVYSVVTLGFRRAARPVIYLTAGCALIVAPWAARNWVHSGRPVITTHGAIELWFGHNSRTRDVLAGNVSVDRMRDDRYERLPELRGATIGPHRHNLSREVAESDVFLATALRNIAAEPWTAIAAIPLKLQKFWSWQLNPPPVAGSDLVRTWWPRVYAVSCLVLFAFSFWGLGVALHRRDRHLILVVMLFVSYSMLHAAVYGFSRLRLPLDQFLIIIGTYGAGPWRVARG